MERPRATDLRPVDPAAAARRSEQIAVDADAIRTECVRAAGGDWHKWQDDTERFRGALAMKLLTLPKNAMLYGRRREIIESNPTGSLAHLIEVDHWQAFRRQSIVVAARRWLARHGVDLLFIAVPSMPEVYIEEFLDPCPADGIVAPQVRRTFLDLLESEVESVDIFPLMRRRRDHAFQFLPADHHWNQAGMRATVRDVARRLTRYRFAREARELPRRTKTSTGPYQLPATATGTPWRPPFWAGTESQWQRALTTLPAEMDLITAPDGAAVADDPHSPVILIGNSFAQHFRELLIRETNLRIRTRWSNGGTTEAFAEFLRVPAMLDGLRVVIWVTSYDALARFKPLPDEIRKTMSEAGNR